MLRNMETYEVGRHIVGSVAPEDRKLSYGLLSIMPNSGVATIGPRMRSQLAEIEKRAYTIPLEVLADIFNRHPRRFDAAVQLLYGMVITVGSDESFSLIYTPRKGDSEAWIDTAVAVTSGYPIASLPFMIVYSGENPIVAVQVDKSGKSIVTDTANLNALNATLAAELEDTFRRVEPPLFVFEDGEFLPLPIRTANIFHSGLEARLDS